MADPAPKPRKWRRRFKRLILILAVLALVVRVALPIVIPKVLTSVLAKHGIDGHLDDVDLVLLGGYVELRGLELREQAPEGELGAPIAGLDSVVADLDVSALFTGRIRVHRVEVNEVEVWVERDEQGTWSFEKFLPPPAEAGEQQVAEAEPDQQPTEEPEPKPASFGLPFELDQVRIGYLSGYISDRSVVPSQQHSFALHLRIDHLGSTERETNIELVAGGTALDRLSLSGGGPTGGTELALGLELDVRGLRTGELAPWLAPLGIESLAERLDFGAEFALAARPLPEDPNDASLTAVLSKLVATADSVEHLALGEARLSASALLGDELRIDQVLLSGLSARAEILPDGRASALGLAFGPAPGGSAAPKPPKKKSAPKPESDPAPESGLIHLVRFDLEPVRFAFSDRSVEPPVELELEIESRMRDLKLGGIDSLSDALPTPIELTVRAPGAFHQLALVGDATLARDAWQAGFDLELDGLAPTALEGYLTAAGIESKFEHGRLTANLVAKGGSTPEGRTTAEGALTEFELRDGEQLFAVERLSFDGLVSGPDKTHVERVEIAGLSLPARRDAEGVLHTFGCRIGAVDSAPGVPAPQPAPVKAGPAETGLAEPGPVESVIAQETVAEETSVKPLPESESAEPAPRFELATLVFSQSAITFLDEGVDPPHEWQISPAEVGITNLELFGGEPGSGQFSALFDVAGVAQAAGLSGELRNSADGRELEVDATLGAAAIDLTDLTAYLNPLGIDPLLAQGRLDGSLKLRSAPDDDSTPTAQISLEGLALRDGERDLWRLGELRVDGARFGPEQSSIEQVALRDHNLEVTRRADGRLELFGLLLGGEVPAPEPAEVGSDAAPTVAATDSAPKEPAADSKAGGFRLDRLRLEQVGVTLTDRTFDQPLEERLELAVRLDDFLWPEATTPAHLVLGLGEADRETWIELAADVLPTSDQLSLSSELQLMTSRSATLSRYWPPTLTSTAETLWFGGPLDVELRTPPGMPMGLEVAVDLRSGADETAGSMSLSTRISASSLDAETGLVIESAEFGGVVDSGIDESGVPYAAGLSFLPAPEELHPATPPASPEEVVSTEEPGPAGPVRRGPREAALLVLPKLELSEARLRAAVHFEDRRTPEAEPLDLWLELASSAPIQHLGDDLPEGAQSCQVTFEVLAEAQPLLSGGSFRVTATPLDEHPHLEAVGTIEHLYGTRLVDVSPTLAETVDASAFEDGRFDLNWVAEWERSSAGGVALESTLGPIALRAEQEGPILLGLDELHVSASRIDPAGGLVHLETLAFETPRLHLAQTPEGSGLAGLLFLNPSANAEGEEQEDPVEEETETTEPDVSEEVAEAPAENPLEIRIDELTGSGIDVRMVDSSREIPVVLPIAGLDLGVEGFTTRALREPIPVAYQLLLEGGEVDLPERIEASSVVAGVLGAAASAVAGTEGDRQVEPRKLFDEISVSGRSTLLAKPKGVASLNILGFELLGVRGLATDGGVEIGDGILDLSLRTNLRGEEGARIDLKPSLDNLSLSEPAEGPISKFLKLPAPLDTVLFALKDADGEIKIPLSFGVGPSGVSIAEITGTATAALAKVIASAVAAAPLRVSGAVTGLLGFGGEEEEQADQVFEFQFPAGVARLDEAAIEQLYFLRNLLFEDQTAGVVIEHVMSVADWDRATKLANPSAPEALELAAGLREDLSDLLDERELAAERARTRYLVGQEEAAVEQTQRLLALDEELADTRLALGDVLALTRPGAERRAPRRTRATMTSIATTRLNAAEQLLSPAVGETEETRLIVRRARVAEPDEEQRAAAGEAPSSGGVLLVTLRVVGS